MVTMKNNSSSYLIDALDPLPGAQKKAFINDALQTLSGLRVGAPARRPNLPKDDRIALTRVARQTERLIEALNKAQETETATLLLRDAWLNLDDSSGEKLGSPMPTLKRLQEAAEHCLPEKKSAQDIVGKSPASTMAVITLADHFERHFGKLPSIAATSPFIRFIREALIAYDLHVPPISEIRRLVARA